MLAFSFNSIGYKHVLKSFLNKHLSLYMGLLKFMGAWLEERLRSTSKCISCVFWVKQSRNFILRLFIFHSLPLHQFACSDNLFVLFCCRRCVTASHCFTARDPLHGSQSFWILFNLTFFQPRLFLHISGSKTTSHCRIGQSSRKHQKSLTFKGLGPGL